MRKYDYFPRNAFIIFCITCCLPIPLRAAMLTIVADQLNVRSGPDRTYTVIEVVHRDEKFEILEENSGWYRINVEGQTGWISEKGVALIRDETIEGLLQQADQYFSRQQFTTPAGANAFDLYQEVLRKDPDNSHARKKITQMAQTYKTWAENALQRGDDEKARIYYQRYLFIAPDGRVHTTLFPETLQTLPSQRNTPLNIVKLRTDPAVISRDALQQMLRKQRFNHPADWSKYDLSSSITGNFRHEYVPRLSHRQPVVVDYATNLMWQQTGTSLQMNWKEAADYIQHLNTIVYAGHSDWRLPTIEELASLLTSEKQANRCYIPSHFSTTQLWCWSADIVAASPHMAWHISFSSGGIQPHERINSAFVRAVRSILPS